MRHHDYAWSVIEAFIKAHPDMDNNAIMRNIEFTTVREGGRSIKKRRIVPTSQQVMKRITVLRKSLDMPEPKKCAMRGRPNKEVKN